MDVSACTPSGSQVLRPKELPQLRQLVLPVDAFPAKAMRYSLAKVASVDQFHAWIGGPVAGIRDNLDLRHRSKSDTPVVMTTNQAASESPQSSTKMVMLVSCDYVLIFHLSSGYSSIELVELMQSLWGQRFGVDFLRRVRKPTTYSSLELNIFTCRLLIPRVIRMLPKQEPVGRLVTWAEEI